MRLLNTRTYELCLFLGDAPPYAILSHRWLEEEVTFKDIRNHRKRESRKGWAKIENCCKQAAEDGWDYVWIDTCCIDKSDSSELSEAINSMFRWYEDAQVCYAFLDDVPSRYPALDGGSYEAYGRPWPWNWYFRSSQWFTRGWTLQELLAPCCLLFLSADWKTIGSREFLANEISLITGIKGDQLLDFRSCSAATKLSWAAKRQTTRPEDRAYSLFGLLGINLPLLYGEGNRAFARLQTELIRQSADETILLWGERDQQYPGRVGLPCTKLFADSPDDYMAASVLMVWPFDTDRSGFGVANGYLSFSGRLFGVKGHDEQLYAIEMNCTWLCAPTYPRKSPMVLILRNKPPGSALFERASIKLRTREEATALSPHAWEDLGKRDILIVPPDKSNMSWPAAGHLDSTSASLISLSMRDSTSNLNLAFGKAHRYYIHPMTQKWTSLRREPSESKPSILGFHDCHSVFLSKETAIVASDRALIWEVDIYQRGYRERTAKAAVAVQASRSFPSIGIWEIKNGEEVSLISGFLGTTKRKVYPQSLRLGNGGFLRINGRPSPVKGAEDLKTQARKAAEAEFGRVRTDGDEFLRITTSITLEFSFEIENDDWHRRYTLRDEISKAGGDDDYEQVYRERQREWEKREQSWQEHWETQEELRRVNKEIKRLERQSRRSSRPQERVEDRERGYEVNDRGVQEREYEVHDRDDRRNW